jgi:TPR repeat protein
MAHYQPSFSATYVPGYDDYYQPPAPELVAPKPFNPTTVTEGISHMNLSAQGQQSPMSPSQPHNKQYSSLTPINDGPHLSPFPKLTNRPPNVPPSDDDLEETLESARTLVLNSNDPEMQLAWAADALVYVGVCADNEERVAAAKPHAARAATPRIEHQLKTDAMNITTFLADQHHPKAEFLRGMWLEWGRFGQREDKKEAFRCYSRAADRGYARAEYRIGMLYESYNDPAKALRHYHKGVDAGDSASCYRLGMMTLRGQHGQQQDYAKAVDLIRRSADSADENAAQGAYVYGMLLARQLPQIDLPEGYLPRDDVQARVNIEKAAYLKFAKAQLKMGSAYELGSLGCEFNPALSVHYNALASKQGEAEADMALSKWFLVGSEGLFPKNEELAFVYAERAAQSGLATGEFALGYFHEIGMYVPVDLEKAMEWYQKASTHGNNDASGRIEGLQRKQVLSKKDHESVAVSRIKSMHGSMRGARPERFKQTQQPSRLSQSTIVEDPTSPIHSNGSVMQHPPPRGSSITPYPEDSRPSTVGPADIRAQTVTPYPLEDGPPKPLPLNPAGPYYGNIQPLRPSTTLNPDVRPSSAFQIAPDYRSQSVAAQPQPPYASRPEYTGGRPMPAARPATVQPYDSRLRPAPAGRVASGPPGMQGYAPQQGAPAPQRPPIIQQSTSPAAPQQASPIQKLDIGFEAPYDNRRNRQYGPSRPLQPEGPPAPPKTTNTMPNFDQQPHNPYSAPSSRPGSSKPVEGRKPEAAAPRPPQKDSVPAAKPPAKASTAPAKPPGKGPKTFDEMGVPAQQKDGECVSLIIEAS